MKHGISLLVFLLFISCENEMGFERKNGDEVHTKSSVESMKIDTTNAIYISTLEDLYSLMGKAPENEYVNPMIPNTRAGVTTYTHTGHDSCKPRDGQENVKGRFGTEAAEALGIDPYTFYIIDFCEAKVTVTVPSGGSFIMMDSPECGYKPGVTGQRGYSLVQDGNQYIMTTNLTHIKYDMSGRLIDKWGPRRPENLKWNYGIFR